MNLKNFGNKLKFEESKHSKEKKEKELFIAIVDSFRHSFTKSAQLFLDYRIDIFTYEENYYRIIEDLLLINFGVWKTELILWYVYEGIDENGKPNVLEIELPDETKQTVKFPTTNSLWQFIVKMDKQLNKEK
jgi:hypothetical protein